MALKTNENARDPRRGSGMSMAQQLEQNRQQRGNTPPPQNNQGNQDQTPPSGYDSMYTNSWSSGLAVPLASNPYSDVLNRAITALEDVYKNQKDDRFTTRLVPIANSSSRDNSQRFYIGQDDSGIGLAVSVVLVCVQYSASPKAGVGYHTLLIADTGAEFKPWEVPVPNQPPLTLTRTASEAFDGLMEAEIERVMADSFGDVPHFPADANLVPHGFQFQDSTLVKRVAGNAILAAATELGRHQPNYKPFSVALPANVGKGVDQSLSLATSFGNPQTADSKGQPVRSDVQLKFSTGPMARTNQQNQSLNQQARVDIATLTGYVDVVHEPTEDINSFRAAAMAAQRNAYGDRQAALERYQQFYARFTITQMKVGTTMTLPMQLLGVAVATTLREPGAWYPAFRQPYRNQRGQQQQVNLKDIGIIGLELPPLDPSSNVSAKIETQVETFTEQDLGDLLSTAFHPGCAITLDVPDTGDESWFNGTFARAAVMPENTQMANYQDAVEAWQAANEEIIGAANVLTGNYFSEYYAGNGIVVTNERNRKHLGQYQDHEGVWRDLRDFDYVTAAILFDLDNNRNGARDWMATYLQDSYPIDRRLAQRERVLRNYFNRVEITGYATPVTFNRDFLDALLAGLDKCRLRISEANPNSEIARYELPRWDYAHTTLMPQGTSPVFTRSGYNPQGSNMPYRPMGRYGA